MNDKATQLLEELGGTAPSAKTEADDQLSEVSIGGLSFKGDSTDRWQMLLVELAYALNASFQDVQYWEGVQNKNDTFLQFVSIMRQLDRMRGHDKTIRINYRGAQLAKVSAKLDYVIQFGDVVTDIAAVSGIIKRQGIRLKHMEGRIKKAFEAFNDEGISSLLLRIPGKAQRSQEIMRISLRILSCYSQAAESYEPISFEKDGKPCSAPPVFDEFNQPDPNLTLLAALNDLSPQTIKGLVQKIAAVAGDNSTRNPHEKYSKVYETVFKIKSLREKLIRPPLEVNTNKSLATIMSQGETAPQELVVEPEGAASARRADLQIDPEILKSGVVQFAKKTFGGRSQNAAQAMKSVFAKDYHQVDLQNLGQRLVLLSDLLNTMDRSPKGQRIIEGVLETLQNGIDQVPKELIDDLVVQDNVVKFWSGEEETVVGRVDNNLLDVLEVSKERANETKKQRTVVDPHETSEHEDYQALADDYGLSVEDAEHIVRTYRSCFDQQGNFQRAAFAKNVPEFARFDKNIFDIMWQFLKETPQRKDRLPFLNSLQLLVNEIKQPLKAIKSLLADFILNPYGVGFADRNAMMLATQFLRTYNKEINMDIEITPEEVLLVKAGLNQEVAAYAAWRVDGEQNNGSILKTLQGFYRVFVAFRNYCHQPIA